jgi:hypothetical protein
MAARLTDRVFDMSDIVALIKQADAPHPASLSERLNATVRIVGAD